MKRFSRRTSVGLFFVPVALAPLGCSAPPPPPKVIPKPPVVVAAPPPPAPLPPAHWMNVAGATVIGPQIDGGTLVLVGGRRMLIAADGSTKAETVPSPEPLEEMVIVPSVGGTKRLVARGSHALYRLDDPLGAPKPLTRTENALRTLGSYAGLVAIWMQGSDVPRFIDVETGKLKTLTTLPHLPMRAVAFRDEKEGAAIFEGVGVGVTNDGGTTWKRVTEEVRGDALRLRGVAARNGELHAFVFEDGFSSKIDATAGVLKRADDAPKTDKLDEHPIIRWIHKTDTDPLAIAASGGIEIGEGLALAANNGLLAKVDTKTGAVIALEEFAHEAPGSPCSFQRAGANAWLACLIGDDPDAGLYDRFGVMRVPLGGESIKPDKPVLVRSGEAELRTSPSGGVLLMAPCDVEEGQGEVCVRQPDGRWLGVSADVELYLRGVGPLSDGRVAFLRNMWPNDVPESEQSEDDMHEEETDPEAEGDRMDREVPEKRRMYIAAVGVGHKEERIATLNWRPMGEPRVVSPIQEDAEHTLHFLIADEDGVYSVVQPLDKEARTPTRLDGMVEGRLRGSRGIVIGMDGVRATTDGGRTWTGLPVPTRAREALGMADSIGSDPSIFGVSEVGMLLDRAARIGWGNMEQLPDPIEPAFAESVPSVMHSGGAERVLTCTVDAGTIQGTPALASNSQITALLGKKTPPPKGTRRTAITSTASTGTVFLFEEEGSDKPGALPTKWTLSWFDPGELGGKPRTWTGAPPKDTPWGTVVRATFGTAGRALVQLRIGSNKNLILRAKANGGIETAEIAYDLMPSADVVFGLEKGEPIAWTRDTNIVVWISGEAPRAIGHTSYRGTRLLGEPTKDGVPVLMSSSDWSVMRIFPIPPADKKNPKPEPLAPTLDGWIPAPNVASHVGRFAPCTAKPAKGALHFSPMRSYARATVDNGSGSLNSSRYDVFVNGTEACVSTVSAYFSSDRRYVAPQPAQAGAKPKPLISFIRADFLAKKAEGGTRGLPAKDVMAKLACTLEERK